MPKNTEKSPIAGFETVPADSLTLDPSNVRKHGKRNLETIKASLLRFGQQHPLVVNPDGVVVAGNGRLAAMRDLGWKNVNIVRTDLKGAEATAFAIADNRTAELAEWDDDGLAETLAALQNDETIDHLSAGFTDEEIDAMVSGLAGDVEVEEDEVPEPPVDPVTKTGDLWLLGDHRLLCGDSTNSDDADRLMGGVKAHMTVTDPPYNIDYENIKHPKFKSRKIENDNMSTESFRDFCGGFAQQILNHCSGCIYVFGPPGPDGRVMFSELDRLLHCSTTVVWNKDQFTLGRGKYQNKYEPCWFGWVENGSRFTGDRTLTNVWDFPRPKSSKEHPTMKPVELISHAISHASLSGDIVLDLFLGSGTTIIAAEQLGRKCYGIEISPAYCDVIVKRWENLTGEKAVLESE